MQNKTSAAVEIVSYQTSWAADFATIAQRLRQAAGDLALRIDHIGSTSVKGLDAKDRIDIQITVAQSADYDVLRTKLQSIGYECAEQVCCDHVPPWGPFDDVQWEKRFFRPPANQRPTNLHVRVDGLANQRYALLFRDYLRVHPMVASAYAAAKRRIAQYHSDDSAVYCDIKDPVCDLIALGAQEWALAQGWQPGQSDA
jgi:GrpB-like predicted nucleotidyltransferase (UPF0157 family)